jgi:hypothetical protein
MGMTLGKSAPNCNIALRVEIMVKLVFVELPIGYEAQVMTAFYLLKME